MTKIAGSGSGSISQRHGSADPDLDPPQNVMDSHATLIIRFRRPHHRDAEAGVAPGAAALLAPRLLPGGHGPVQPRQAGLEKTQPSGFFWVFFFLFFLGCFIQKREFLDFFSFKNTFRCFQTLNYNHSH
jgi:hypothetical protein